MAERASSGRYSAVVSNHPDVAETAERYGIPFHHLPVTADTKAERAAIIPIVDEHNVDLVVLARYMQILSDDLCQRLTDEQSTFITHYYLVSKGQTLPPSASSRSKTSRRHRALRHRSTR